MRVMDDLTTASGRKHLSDFYRSELVDDVVPFWLRYGLDREYGGMLTALDRDGSLLDTDKSVWFQGRAGWMFSRLYATVLSEPAWLEVAKSCADFSIQHCHAADGKMWFSVTREGLPLRMRRYVFSEAFAAISYASLFSIAGEERYQVAAKQAFERYLVYSFQPGIMAPKVESTRVQYGIGAWMIAIVTAQELRQSLGDIAIDGRTMSMWIEWSIQRITEWFVKPEQAVVMELVGDGGCILPHMDGRTLNPGHAIECAWFIMREGQLSHREDWIELGSRMLDWMWARGWDPQYGGLLYFTDLDGRPVQEYWHDMKFWWPHCEAIIASLMAWRLTGDSKYAQMHAEVHQWSFEHFPDKQYGEWYGYLHRDGSVSQPAKGNMYKGPFHLPRMLWIASELLASEDFSARLQRQ